jgi:hypothetical protein
VTRGKDAFDSSSPSPQEGWTNDFAGHPKGESAISHAFMMLGFNLKMLGTVRNM